jgi:hypothetical protein
MGHGGSADGRLRVPTRAPFIDLHALFGLAGKLRVDSRNHIRIAAPAESWEPRSRGFPCIFRTDQGIAPRDEFAPDSLHRH